MAAFDVASPRAWRREGGLSGAAKPVQENSMTRKTILKFGAVEHAEAGDLPGWIVVEGSPTMQTAVQHTTADGKVMSGTWRATPGTYHATYTDYEFVHMIAGRIIITPDGGEPVEVGPGDAFVVEADFKGTWKIVEPVTKHFVVKVD
jgi:uncharacterized cupin superfamily protein